MNKGLIGIGYITCNNQDRFLQTIPLIPDLGVLVVVNDGRPYDQSLYPAHAHLIQHEQNKGVAVSKNDALRYLMDKGCEHLFLIEDDVLIRNTEIFQTYINASKETGIRHFNYALQGPHNRIQKNVHYSSFTGKIFNKIWSKIRGKKSMPQDASMRLQLDPLSPPAPRLSVNYSGGTKLRLYRNCVGAFSYYHRPAIEQAGYMDENFKNAWEHVHHTYKIIQKNMHPPFWWFADVAESETMLDNTADCIAESTIGKSEKWLENVERGAEYFKSLEGKSPGEIRDVPEIWVKWKLWRMRRN
jgi:glycosyltransferase involved in cell wall biosynthesis